METFLCLKAPAKLNIFLDIISKRKDGYHEILTLMCKINLYDLITLAFSDKNELEIDCNISALKGEKNIVYRTVKELKRLYGIKVNFKINIEKNIPIGSGLGGASSDCAEIMKAILNLNKIEFDQHELFKIASHLGSDVSFFLSNAAWALIGGKGDIVLRQYTSESYLWAIVIYPGVSIVTKEAYAKWKPSLTTENQRHKIIMLEEDINWTVIKEINYNIFERISIKEEINAAKERLKEAGAEVVSLTGSGSCIYGLFPSAEKARQVYKKLKVEKNWRCWMVRTI